MDARRLQGLSLAAASGILYGSINVLSKPLEVHPILKVAIAYLVSALVLAPNLRGFHVARHDHVKVWTMGLLGGALAPLLLFYGLLEAAAADAGLLLTLEFVATALLAMVFLRERFAAREVGGLGLLLLAALLVALASAGDQIGASTIRGVLLVCGSALAWGVDNTVSTRLVGTYRPAALISVKGFIGGGTTLAAALLLHLQVPEARPALGMAALGIVTIAVSSLCFYHALRRVGAGRTSAMNVASTALIGAFGGYLLLHEGLHALHFAALAAVLAGATLLARQGRPVELGPGTVPPS